MSGWTRLKRDAELIDGTLPEHEANLNRRFKDMLHIDDPDYIQVIRDIGQGLYKEEPLFQLLVESFFIGNPRIRLHQPHQQVNST